MYLLVGGGGICYFYVQRKKQGNHKENTGNLIFIRDWQLCSYIATSFN